MKRFTRSIFCWFVCMAFAIPALAVDVWSTHPVYDFLNRCELRGLTEDPLSGSRPYSRLTVASILLDIAEDRAELSRVERQLLDRYLYEFGGSIERLQKQVNADSYEPRWSGVADWTLAKKLGIFQNRRDVVEYKGDDWAVYANAAVAFEHFSRSLESDKRYSVRSYGFDSWAWYKKMDFAGWTTENQVYGDADYISRERFPYHYGEAEGDEFDFYEAEASVSYQDEHFLVFFGKGENKWGYSPESSLTLSPKGIPYTHLRLKGKLGPIEMTIVQGKLMADPAIVTRVDTLVDGRHRAIFAEKYIAAHRLQWNMSKRIQLGLFEEVFYGKRDMEWEYLPPILFFRGAEHYRRSEDNMLIGLDLRVKPVKGVSLYAELLLDELRAEEIGTDYFTNKHGLLLNGMWANPFGLSSSLLYADYIAVRPYVYTHKYPVNVADHYGTTLADPGVPNSQRIRLGLKKDLTSSLRCSLLAERFSYGLNPEGKNIGGDHFISQEQGGEEHVEFLGGDLHTWDRLELSFDWEVMYDWRIKAAAALVHHTFEYEAGGDDVDENGLEWRIGFYWHPVR